MKKSFISLISIFSIVALSLFFSPAQGQLTPNSPKAKIRVESVSLCPGQTADVAVYVDFGEYATTPGVRAMENFMFFLFLSDTTVCEIVSSYKRNSYNYWVCDPVLKDMHPNIKCCMQNSYLYGTGWQSSQDRVYTDTCPNAGRFASTWFANESQAFMLTDSVPLFRIRIRCKKEGICRLDFCDWSQMAFSTGPSYFGGEYFDFRGGITNGVIDASSGRGPDKSLVDAGRDSLLCVGSRLTLNGEGGCDYKWTEISGKGATQNQFLAGSKTKNPTFTPQQEGEYRFQMEAYAPNGCATLDTVVYTVGANHITDATLSPDWNFIDPGSSVIFKTEANTTASSYPLTVTFSPDSLFAEVQNVFEMTQGESVYVSSMPMNEPNLVAATIEDKFGCKKELSSSVFIKGKNITGYLNPFPVYRCGNDNSDKSIQLNVLTKGGSGKFNYKWTVTDLEGNVAAPVIDNPFTRSPRLTYQGLCAVSVSVYDLVTGEDVLISDTMIYRDWLHPSVEVVVDTLASGLEPGQPVGPFCEGRELAFKLHTVYAGEEPAFMWRINGITQEDATGETFSAVLDHDDYVDVIMYSDEECVAERSVQSSPLGINVRYPVYMNANVVNSSGTGEPYLTACYDSVKYRVLTWNAGKDYTITWLRNGKDIIYREQVHADNEEHSEIDVVLPRTGFYDNYACAISNVSMPCAVFDSITTEGAYLNTAFMANKPPVHTFSVQLPAELAPIQTKFASEVACEGMPITVTTDIRYLPRDFTMIWFKKPKDGGDSVFLGFYRYDLKDENNNLNYGADNGFVPQEISDNHYRNADYNLVKILGYNATVTNTNISNTSSPMAKIRTVVAEGFKLVLNDPSLKVGNFACEQLNEGFVAGDTLYYVLYTPGTECGTGLRRYRSQNFVPNLIKSNDYSKMPLVLHKEGSEFNCPTAPMVVTASILNLPDDIKPLVRYEWRYDGRYEADNSYYLNPLLESDLFPDYSVLGAQKDTLYVTHSPADMKITCRAVFDFSCGTWGSNKYEHFNFGDYVLVGAPDFTITHIEADTIVCAGSEVNLWALAKENKTYKNKRKAARAAAEYEYAWGNDWAALPKEDPSIGAGSSVPGMSASGKLAVTPVPAVIPQGYWSDWNEQDGITTYYLSVHHKSADCWAYDSVRLVSAPDRDWTVSLQFTKQGMWCDSAKTGPQAQRIYLKSDDDPDVSYAWYLNDKRQFNWSGDTICVAGLFTSDTIKTRVYSDLITCRDYEKTVKMGIPYHESPADVLTLATPEWARVGEKVLLEAGAVYEGKDGTQDNDYLHNVTYRWEKQERNGTWTAIPASLHGIADPTYNTDSTSVLVSDYMPRYRVIAEGLHHLCPADTGWVEVPVAVPVGVTLDVVEIKSDNKDGQPIFGMCSQSDDYVKMTGVSGNTGTVKDTLFDVYTGKKVRVRVAPQNPGAESWVMYYRNGRPVAAGPVGSVRPNPSLPKPGTVDYDILADGEYYDMALREMDEVYVMYGTDTVSADGLNTHYSPKYVMWRLEPNGMLELVSDDQVVCPNGEVDLRVYFVDSVDTYGHIDKTQELTWEPAAALQGTPRGWTAVGKPTEETVYKATAVDGMHCPWMDSLRIYLMQDGVAFSVPFKIVSPDSVFCGGEVRTGLQAYIPDNNKGLSSTFSEVTYYVCDASGAVKASVKGLDSVRLQVAVQNGWMAYATALLKASCNTEVSYSDTVVFRSVDRPVIERISPLSQDTVVCASNPLALSYAQPEGSGFAWHSVLAPMGGGESSLERRYRVDRSTEVVFEAYRNELPSCRSFDTVYVEVLSGGNSGRPSLTLTASAEAACGEESVTYTLQKRNCDTIIWYVNGVEAARDVLTLTRVPRSSGLTGAPDTVQVYGSRAANVCDGGGDPIYNWSNVVLTRRVERPVLGTNFPSDTVVEENATLKLQATATVKDGAPASFLWMKGEEEVGHASTYRFVVTEPDVYTVRAYQEAALTLAENCWSEAVVNVAMIKDGDTIDPLPMLSNLVLSASASWLCGENEVTYTLASVEGYDTLVWYENGREIARDVWQLTRTPAYTGFDRADTVFVQGIAVGSVSEGVDTVRYRTSNILTIHRIEKPVFVWVSPRDTLVQARAEVTLSALATAPDGPEIRYFWIDSLGEESDEGATFRIEPVKTQHYYVIAEQLENFCYAEDSVLVRVQRDTTIKMGEIEVYIPNTVIPNSQKISPYTHKPENMHLRVYGLNIKYVHLQVFNERSEKLYEGEGDAESTVWNATGTDGKIVPEGTYSYKATVIVVDEQGNEYTINKQSWVQVIL